MIGGDFFIF
jgi:hypothetical protein